MGPLSIEYAMTFARLLLSIASFVLISILCSTNHPVEKKVKSRKTDLAIDIKTFYRLTILGLYSKGQDSQTVTSMPITFESMNRGE